MFRKFSSGTARNARRFATGAGSTGPGSKSGSSKAPGGIFSKFDRSMIYPIVLVSVLSAQIVNFSSAQRDLADLNHRYSMKIQRIQDIVARLEQGEKVDVGEELRLINLKFDRLHQPEYSSLDVPLLERIRQKKQQQQELLKSQEAELSEENLLEMLSARIEPGSPGAAGAPAAPAAPAGAPAQQSAQQAAEQQLVDYEQQQEREKELLNYRINAEKHVIVEVPGDLVQAAKDTKVSKFL